MRCTANYIRWRLARGGLAGKVFGIPRRAERPEVAVLGTLARLVVNQRQGVAMVGAPCGNPAPSCFHPFFPAQTMFDTAVK